MANPATYSANKAAILSSAAGIPLNLALGSNASDLIPASLIRQNQLALAGTPPQQALSAVTPTPAAPAPAGPVVANPAQFSQTSPDSAVIQHILSQMFPPRTDSLNNVLTQGLPQAQGLNTQGLPPEVQSAVANMFRR